MSILNLYFSSTGNTKKVAEVIAQTSASQGHSVETVRIRKTRQNTFDLMDHDIVFAGSGVYEWLPGVPVVNLFGKLARDYREQGLIEQPAERRRTKKAVVYCTYGGTHTGASEAVPAVKFMGQLFDHLGFEIVGEWYVVGEFHGGFRDFSKRGKLGDITGRPSGEDLRQISEMVKGVLKIKG